MERPSKAFCVVHAVYRWEHCFVSLRVAEIRNFHPLLRGYITTAEWWGQFVPNAVSPSHLWAGRGFAGDVSYGLEWAAHAEVPSPLLCYCVGCVACGHQAIRSCTALLLGFVFMPLLLLMLHIAGPN